MLTQMEFLGATDGLATDDDVGMSPIDDLSEYSIKHSDFEYFETGLPSDTYFQGPEKQDFSVSFPLSSAPGTVLTATPYDANSCDNTIVLYDGYIEPFEEEREVFGGDVRSSELEDGVKSVLSEFGFDDDASSNDYFSGTTPTIAADDAQGFSLNFGCLQDSFSQEGDATDAKQLSTDKNWEEGAGKAKIDPLQRRALDEIFSVTDKPSRGLVLHIASELGLHHLTVKKFFSNARRRLRRAAARLSDPERTRRENERRKEKRRLAALASAAVATGATGKAAAAAHASCASKAKAPRTPPADSPPPKEAAVISPERRALMEKLADKVQRSVAQRSMAADLDLLRSAPPSSGQTTATAKTFSPPIKQEILPPNDLLSQASQDILAESARELLGTPHDFLCQPSALTLSADASPPSLHAHSDPWNLF